jgi:hypothetical protein
MRSASSAPVRKRKAPAVAGKTDSENGEATSLEDSVATQIQPGIHSTQTPHGRRLELEYPDPPPWELTGLSQKLNVDSYPQHAMTQLITGDRPHSNYNYAIDETFLGPGLGNGGGYHHHGYRRPDYEHSDFMREISDLGAYQMYSTADTGREIGDAEAQQLTPRHVTQPSDSIDIFTNLEHEVGSPMQDGPWNPINLRIDSSVQTREHEYAALPAIGPFGPPGPGAEYTVSRYLKKNKIYGSNTKSSLESPSQATESSTESRPNAALSSTLPTSRGAHVHEHDCSIDKQATADLRDSETIYSLESAVDHDRYIAVFAHRLLSDLTITTSVQNLSNLHPDFVKQTLKLFATRLHWESTNLFQRATSVVLHKKRG